MMFKHALMLVLGLCLGMHTAHAASLRVHWSVDVDQRPPNAPVALSAPAIVTGGERDYIVLGGRDAWLHVYDVDGRDVRRIRLQAPSDSGTLALADGLVVLADVRGTLYGIDPFKGVIRWQKQLTSGVTSAPVAVGEDFLVQTTDNRIYRFSSTGEKRWSFAGQNNTLSMYFTSQPLVYDGHVYALLNQGDAVALRADNGDVVWKRQLLLSLDSASLSELEVPLATPVFVPHLKLEGEQNDAVLLMPFFQGDMKIVDQATGAPLMHLPVSLATAPVQVGSTLFMADSTGAMHAYDLQSGTRIWHKKISDNGLLGPILWHDLLWVVDRHGQVFAIGKQGDVQAKMALSGSVSRPLIATDYGLLVRTERGEMSMVSLDGTH